MSARRRLKLVVSTSVPAVLLAGSATEIVRADEVQNLMAQAAGEIAAGVVAPPVAPAPPMPPMQVWDIVDGIRR